MRRFDPQHVTLDTTVTGTNLEVRVEVHYFPGEPQTYRDPGCGDGIEVLRIEVRTGQTGRFVEVPRALAERYERWSIEDWYGEVSDIVLDRRAAGEEARGQARRDDAMLDAMRR